MIIKAILSLFRRRRPAPVVINLTAEAERAYLMARIAASKAGHREWKPLLSELRRATNASLSAQIGRE